MSIETLELLEKYQAFSNTAIIKTRDNNTFSTRQGYNISQCKRPSLMSIKQCFICNMDDGSLCTNYAE
eukprot:c38486_g1_i1 orf=121-324(+)